MSRRRIVSIAALGALAPPAAYALMVGEPPDSPRARLDDNRVDSHWSGVASLFVGGSVCSAVLVTPSQALTAAHVIVDGVEITLNLNLDGDLSHQITVRRALRHPEFRGISGVRPLHDIALLELAETVPAAARRYAISRRGVRPGDPLHLVGYGGSGRGSRGVEVGSNAALRRSGLVTVRRVDVDESSQGALLYFFDYLPSDRLPRGSPAPTGLAPGDSGGGAFRTGAGEPVLAGISTITMRPAGLAAPAFGYGTIGGGQVLAAQAQWLARVAPDIVWMP